ncbi:MAG: tRNA pseudouridine(55) synthase TruB [Deltaproteobacteria bacterium]|nr:tRNA pseudouridine(55) synthase TruB [Deltaproteobacteria bacterium]
MENSCDGILLIDKKAGETSFEAARRIGRILKAKKVGHAGTLDPFATGLLIILLGQGTKLFPYLMPLKKKYTGILRLGIETDTQDLSGRVLNVRPVPEYDLDFLREKARDFVGEIEQVPPKFSAVRYEGKRAYEYARKGIEFELGARKVKVYSFEILATRLPEVTIQVVCSGGTYIRSLVSDFGTALGPGAHLVALRRESCGPFDLGEAVSVEETRGPSPGEFLKQRIIPLAQALPHVKEIGIGGDLAEKIRKGYQPRMNELIPGGAHLDSPKEEIKLVKDEELVALARVPEEQTGLEGRLKILRVFNIQRRCRKWP